MPTRRRTTCNWPVVKDVLGLRVSGTLAKYGGWIDQPAPRLENINDQNLKNVRAKALWQPTPAFRLTATVAVHRNRGDGITAGADEDYQVRFPNDPAAREGFNDRYELYNATATYDWGGVRLLSSTSRVRSNKDVAGLAFDLPGFQAFIGDDLRFRSTSQEARLTSNRDGRASWVIGGFYTNERLARALFLEPFSSGVALGRIDLVGTDTSKSWSAFGDVNYDLTRRLNAGAGVRYFRDRRGTESGDQAFRGTFRSTDPRFYLSFALNDKTKLYANVAKGFRSGGFTGDLTEQTFGPERVWSYEAGVKGAASQVTWELTGFFGQYKDVQAFVLQSAVFGGLTNAGDAHIRGIDAAITFDPTSRLTLQGSVNVTRTELVEINPSSTANIAGDRLDLVPDHAFSLSAEYRFDWGPSAPGYVRVDYNQVGKSTFTDRTLSAVPFPSETIDLLNARLGLTRGRFTVELFGQNLGGDNDEQDALHGLGFGARPRPRTIGLSVGATF